MNDQNDDTNADHVTRYTATPRSSTISNRGSSNIPSEIMLMVYSYCSIESCVALRQVDSHWYTVFNGIETLLRRKLVQRNPWLKRDGKDLQTWADCALVFAARVKWPSVGHVDELISLEVKPAVSKPVTPVPLPSVTLRPPGRLPDNFEAMRPLQGGHCIFEHKTCDHLHAPSRGCEHIQDLRSLQIQEVHEQHKVHLPVVTCRGLEITLPPWAKAHDIEPFDSDERRDLPVQIFAKTVIVRFKKSHVLAVPRHAPSYKNGVLFRVGDSFINEIGGVLHVFSGRKSHDINKMLDTTHVLDLESKRTIIYATRSRSLSVAFHKGIFWRYVDFRVLIPTFIDLRNPKKLHYNAARAISSNSGRTSWRQGTGDFCKYVMAMQPNGIDLVDVDTGMVTAVRSKYELHQCIPGFVDEKFRAYSMSMGEGWKRKEEVWMDMVIPEKDWQGEYDSDYE